LGPSGAKVIAPSQGPVYCASQKIPKKFSAQKMYILNKHKERKEIHKNFSSSSQKTRLVPFSFLFFDLKKHRALDSQQVHKTQDG
jgi:hypothetical protein